MYIMFVQAGLDRHKGLGGGRLFAEYIKKQMKENIHILLAHPIRYGNKIANSHSVYVQTYKFIYHKPVALHLCFCQRHIVTPSCL